MFVFVVGREISCPAQHGFFSRYRDGIQPYWNSNILTVRRSLIMTLETSVLKLHRKPSIIGEIHFYNPSTTTVLNDTKRTRLSLERVFVQTRVQTKTRAIVNFSHQPCRQSCYCVTATTRLVD